MLNQTVGWTSPKLRDPDAADRWTRRVLAAYTQLRLARTAPRRPTPLLGTPRPARKAHPRPCPARLSEPAR